MNETIRTIVGKEKHSASILCMLILNVPFLILCSSFQGKGKNHFILFVYIAFIL